jgi:hypothetical protein
MSVARAMFSMHAAVRAFIPWGPCVMRQFHQQLSGRIRSKRFSLSSTRYSVSFDGLGITGLARSGAVVEPIEWQRI